jgi:hypothetical protein
MKPLIIVPNATNGICLVDPPWNHVLYFQSCHGEHKKSGYFSEQSVPLNLILEMLANKHQYQFVDGTSSGNAPRAFLTGLLTFAAVWDRARLGKTEFVGIKADCNLRSFEECFNVSLSDTHKKLISTIRKFARRICGDVSSMPGLNIKYASLGHYISNNAESFVDIDLRWQKVSFDDDEKEIFRILSGRS